MADLRTVTVYTRSHVRAWAIRNPFSFGACTMALGLIIGGLLL